MLSVEKRRLLQTAVAKRVGPIASWICDEADRACSSDGQWLWFVIDRVDLAGMATELFALADVPFVPRESAAVPRDCALAEGTRTLMQRLEADLATLLEPAEARRVLNDIPVHALIDQGSAYRETAEHIEDISIREAFMRGFLR